MPPRRWTTEELETANIMMGEGASFSDIAKKLDRTASAVESKLKGKKASSSGAAASKSKPVADSASQPEKASTTTSQYTPARVGPCRRRGFHGGSRSAAFHGVARSSPLLPCLRFRSVFSSCGRAFLVPRARVLVARAATSMAPPLVARAASRVQFQRP